TNSFSTVSFLLAMSLITTGAFMSFLLLKKIAQTVEPLGPQRLVGLQQSRRLPYRVVVARNHLLTALASLEHQAGLQQHLDVFGHRGERHGVPPGQLGDGEVAAQHAGQHVASGSVPKRSKHSVEVERIFNHLVEYSARSRVRQAKRWPSLSSASYQTSM